MFLFVVIVLALFVPTDSAGKKCESLKNIVVSVRTNQGKLYNKTVDGCIQREEFDDVILHANVKNQTVKSLGPDSVKNMRYLHSVQFYRCQIESVEFGAFRNVPNLRSVQIVSNELSRVVEGAFWFIPNLEILKLNRNKIDVIEDGAFFNLTNLKKVYLGHNLLENWSKEWFAYNYNLQVINFEFNKIKVLPKEAFVGLPKLKEINFNYNELNVVGEEVFKGVTKLDYLGLKYNRLKMIDYNAFLDKIAVRRLAVDANYLNFFSKKLREKIEVEEIIIQGNPWKCACYNEILAWLHNNNGTLKKSDSCQGKDIPICLTNEPQNCTEIVDEVLTTEYIEQLKKFDPPLYCARLD